MVFLSGLKRRLGRGGAFISKKTIIDKGLYSIRYDRRCTRGLAKQFTHFFTRAEVSIIENDEMG